MVTNRKSAIKVRRVSRASGEVPTPRTSSGVHPVVDTLRVIENRARLSLDCYRYTKDPYWLSCAFADCEKGGLDWNVLCLAALGAAVAPPGLSAVEAPPPTRPSTGGRE